MTNLREAVARALYEHREGPVANADFSRQQALWHDCLLQADAALAAIEADMVDKADAWDCSVAGSRASYQRGRLAGLDEGIAERDALRAEVARLRDRPPVMNLSADDNWDLRCKR